MGKAQPYRFVPQTSYYGRAIRPMVSGSGFPPPEPLFFLPLILPPLARRVPPSPRYAQGCPGNRRRLQTYRSAQPNISVIRFARAPLRPSGGRGRGPRSGRVRWTVPRTGSSAPLTLPSPPGRRGERVSRFRFAGNFADKFSERWSANFLRTALRYAGRGLG